eukprot:TRINITY_DN51714_c0_g1_i1.p1 TRINITY_DN51714_c0_g1~~TRINITY_DN51714_c0_g1_i1.p1  ORF type:complete len:115 (-),score=22.45 TRINITY_DN51714_c0_g1_i1:178-522(-)
MALEVVQSYLSKRKGDNVDDMLAFLDDAAVFTVNGLTGQSVYTGKSEIRQYLNDNPYDAGYQKETEVTLGDACSDGATAVVVLGEVYKVMMWISVKAVYLVKGGLIVSMEVGKA